MMYSNSTRSPYTGTKYKLHDNNDTIQYLMEMWTKTDTPHLYLQYVMRSPPPYFTIGWFSKIKMGVFLRDCILEDCIIEYGDSI